jgi:class 3 adenylate cyclase
MPRTDDISHNSAARGTVGTAPRSQGMEHPHEVADAQPLVERSFSFIDLCAFTRFTADKGEHAAIETLQYFRSLTREVAVRRGVLINKWLGDGALIVGADIGPIVAAITELVARYEDQPLAIRGGIAHGKVLIIDGDDYIGRPVNLAARLCQAALPGELLAVNLSADALPAWTQVLGTRGTTVRSIGSLPRIHQLGLAPHVSLPELLHKRTGGS